MIKRYWLYILELENACFYVGVTSRNVDLRFKEHLNGFHAARWTRKHRPIKVLDKKDLGLINYEQAQVYEQKATLKYIDRYGIDQVRGGELTYEGKYKSFLGRYLEKEDHEVLMAILFLMLIILALGVLSILQK